MRRSPRSGVFTGAYAINPITDERIPIWIADYVLMGYGTGAIMAVPAHDERDFAFAKAFDLPIRVVIQPDGETLDPATMTEAYHGNGLHGELGRVRWHSGSGEPSESHFMAGGNRTR